MSRESGTSEGGDSAGRDLWPAGARDVPRLRGEVVPGERDGVIIHSGGASISVTDVSGIDPLANTDDELVVYIKGTRLAIRLNDHPNGASSATSARSIPSDSGDRAMDRVMRTGSPATLPPTTQSGPSIEIVRRSSGSLATNANGDYVRRGELSVPWQGSPIELWTSAAQEPEDEADAESPVGTAADENYRVTPLRIVPPVRTEPDDPSSPAGEPSHAGPVERPETLGEVDHDETGEPVRFRSVWDTPIWQDDPIPEGDEPPVEVPSRVEAGTSSGWDEPVEEPEMPASVGHAPDDDAVAPLRPNRTKRLVKRVATGALVAVLLAGALYGGSIVGARLIGDGNPPEQTGPPVAPDVVIRNVVDTGDATVSRFNVEGAWTINWSATGTGPFQVVAIDSEGSSTTVVDATGPDSGVAQVDQTGVFSLEVVAEGEWRLAVLEQSSQG